jgi:hypothetical protein
MPASISDTVTGDGLKTSILGDHVKKCQHEILKTDLSSHWSNGKTTATNIFLYFHDIAKRLFVMVYNY